MKTIIIILLFGFCLGEEKVKTEVECECRLQLNSGKKLQKIEIPTKEIAVSNQCNTDDFILCAEACNQKISNETNGYNLTEPQAGVESSVSLGQSYCDKIGHDVRNARIYQSVTLECEIEREITQERNGTVISVGTSESESSITRFVESGFKQSFNCVDKKFALNE
ncbi:unnamed protein product [Medioppia subpectinata]|uniref:Uncharacterized protein n=1 Tax=Medioppia subpectinata TaxID=1979941 RepID=A0A7R9KB25_9ACAR|nr:unnamed protein product [Medioppia subpectinata]CAG2100120.1 unnamed protein product [Medioppia subpectinata]